jgi:hypothetical protein
MSDKSPSQAMTRAIERARELLFPGRMEKWLALGFIAFLAGLGESSGSYSYRLPFPSGSGGSGPFGGGSSGKSATPEKAFDEIWAEALSWVQAHTVLVVAGASGLLLGGLAFGLLLTWLSSRGKLMFVESVIHDRYQVKEPWARLREPAWAVFKFRLLLTLAFLLILVIALGVGVSIALAELKTGHFSSTSVIALFAFGGILTVTFIPLGFISLLLDDFVIPVFYLRGGSLGDAWGIVRRDLIASNAGPVFVFYLLKMVLGVGFVMLGTIAACLTCCVASLPYLSSVVLLPAHVFFRSYSLYFLEELGIAVFPQKPPLEAFAHYPDRFGS